MRSRCLGLALLMAVLGCGDSTGPEGLCPRGGPAVGMPAFDLLGALRFAGATVVDKGPTLWLVTDGPTPHLLEVNGHEVHSFDFACAAEARDYVERFSPDASSYLGVPVAWQGTPHIFLTAQVVAQYVGDDPDLLALMIDVMGVPAREGSPDPGPPRLRPGATRPRARSCGAGAPGWGAGPDPLPGCPACAPGLRFQAPPRSRRPVRPRT
jgi:hypothetical protein